VYKPQAASARTAHLPSSATKSSSANPAIAADISEGEEDDDDDEDEALEALSTASVRRRQMRLATGDQPAREPSLAPAAASAEQQQKNQQQQQQPKTRYVAAKVRMRNRKSEQKLGGQSSSAAGSASTSTAVKDSSQAETASPPAAATATSSSPSPASSPPAAATPAAAGASSSTASSAGQPRKGPRSLTEDEVRAREALNLLRTLEHDVGKHESIAQLVDMVYDYRRRTDGKELVVEGDKGRERKEEVKVETAAGAVSQVVVASPAAKGKAESLGRRGSEYSLFFLFFALAFLSGRREECKRWTVKGLRWLLLDFSATAWLGDF